MNNEIVVESSGTTTANCGAPTSTQPLDFNVSITQLLSPRQRIEDWLRVFKEMGAWCRRDDCQCLENTEKLIKLAVEYQLTGDTPVGRTKEGRVTLLQKVFGEANKCGGADNWAGGGIKGWVLECVKTCNLRRTGAAELLPQTEPPEILYDRQSHKYWRRLPGGWQLETSEQVNVALALTGMDRKSDNCQPSQVEAFLAGIRNEHGIDSVMSLAGWRVGVHEMNGQRVLVPSSFTLPQPKAGAYPNIAALLDGLLYHDRDQFWCLLQHLKSSYCALQAGITSGSVAVFVAGDIDSGKSLLLDCVIVPLLGGRRGNAYKYLSGETKFNKELATSEVWTIDDGAPFADHKARQRFAALVKNSVAAGNVSCEAKGRDESSQPLYRRLFVVMNTTDIELMPALDDSMRDKFMLLQAHRYVPPEGCAPLPAPEQRPAYAALLASELPAFLHDLLGMNLSAYEERRFGVRAYKHPELLRSLNEASGVDERAIVLQRALFGSGASAGRDAVELQTAILYERLMTSRLAGRCRELFRNHRALGIALAALRVSGDYAQLFTTRRLNGRTYWTVTNDPELSDIATADDFDEVR